MQLEILPSVITSEKSKRIPNVSKEKFSLLIRVEYYFQKDRHFSKLYNVCGKFTLLACGPSTLSHIQPFLNYNVLGRNGRHRGRENYLIRIINPGKYKLLMSAN